MFKGFPGDFWSISGDFGGFRGLSEGFRRSLGHCMGVTGRFRVFQVFQVASWDLWTFNVFKGRSESVAGCLNVFQMCFIEFPRHFR